MKKYTRMLAIFEICAIIFLIVSENYTKQVTAQTNGLRESYIKIDVLLYNSSDKFISLVHQKK